MPSLHYMNPPPHPFWDFVAGIEDHPFFGAYGRPPRTAFRGNVDNNEQPRQTNPTQASAETSEKSRDKQSPVEDPPEMDPSTVQPGATQAGETRGFPFRGRGRFANAFEDGEDRRGAHGCRGRGGHRGAHGPPPFMMGGGAPFWARGGPHGSHGPHHGPGPHAHHGPPRGCRRRSPGNQGLPASDRGFDLGNFLNNLGEKLGIDLAGAAENMGVGNFKAPNNNTETDFEPRADIFDTPTNYTIHLSLPGAKKEDVGVDWDGENSVLRIAGVVHRPGVDEEMLAHLTVNGRKRENGVFEKAIRLGTKRDPASIDVANISAKMTDGVLIVVVPKLEVEHKKREVPISGSPTVAPASSNEKDLLFDADHEMYDSSSHAEKDAQEETATVQQDTNNKTMDLDNFTEKPHEKEAEAAARDDRSETAGHEEHLPQYTVEEPHDDSDWEKYSDEEGEYVKINVD